MITASPRFKESAMLRPRTLGLATLTLSLPVLAADALQVKTGLWETTTVTTSSGFSLPAEAAANMPPARRAQMEQMMKQMGSRGPQTSRERSCVTDKDLKEGAFRGASGNDQQNCKYTQVSATPRHQEITFQCSSEGHSGTGRLVIDAIDSTHIRGTIDVKSDAVSMNIKLTGQWLSASCAGADKD